MNKRVNRNGRFFGVMYCGLAALAFCICAQAQGGAKVPVSKCAGTPSKLCVEFGAGEVVGSHALKNVDGSTRATLLSVKSESVWNTTAPVRLFNVPDVNSECPSAGSFVDFVTSPMNMNGSVLFVGQDNAQTMYLVYQNQVLERALEPGHPNGATSGEVLWLRAQRSSGDFNPFDYFIEFRKVSDEQKRYRVEAFPHLESVDRASSRCDCERPDVQFAENPVQACQMQTAKGGPMKPAETSTGEGNEPGHN
jgi:hypothetical protein